MPTRSAPSASAGGHDRLVAFRVEGRGIPRPGMAVRPDGRGHERHDVAVAGRRHRHGATSPRTWPREGTSLEIDARGRPVAARVAKKPLYVKEKAT